MISVVTNCTAKKLDKPAPARELYLGPSVARVAKAVDEARAWGAPVALYIISAKYGLLGEYDVVEPYDETLAGRPREELKRWAAERGVLERLKKLAEASTLVLVLSKPYYVAVEEGACETDAYVIAPFKPNCGRWIRSGNFDKHIALRKLLKELSTPNPSSPTR